MRNCSAMTRELSTGGIHVPTPSGTTASGAFNSASVVPPKGDEEEDDPPTLGDLDDCVSSLKEFHSEMKNIRYYAENDPDPDAGETDVLPESYAELRQDTLKDIRKYCHGLIKEDPPPLPTKGPSPPTRLPSLGAPSLPTSRPVCSISEDGDFPRLTKSDAGCCIGKAECFINKLKRIQHDTEGDADGDDDTLSPDDVYDLRRVCQSMRENLDDLLGTDAPETDAPQTDAPMTDLPPLPAERLSTSIPENGEVITLTGDDLNFFIADAESFVNDIKDVKYFARYDADVDDDTLPQGSMKKLRRVCQGMRQKMDSLLRTEPPKTEPPKTEQPKTDLPALPT
ncbi:hypothetical protein EJ06DRAFT_142710 [Trichodelitschia bisporula]|uniref:Uncharacterized protein n=1 Tax=Trichodelitschia bisporula TaxID=703511 RepID=A0A6G1HPR8_9PEZI|nr:hypothetical protein EJ06DRAFT_142710 [Trichodelitschia bisporula]